MRGTLQAREVPNFIEAINNNLKQLGGEEGLTLDLQVSVPPIGHLEASQVKNMLNAFTTFTAMLPQGVVLTVDINILPSDSRTTQFLTAVDAEIKEFNRASKAKADKAAQAQTPEAKPGTEVPETTAKLRSVEPPAPVDSVATPA